MKKITTLVAMMLLLFTGNALAQQAWEYDPTIVTEIVPGENNFYVLQQGSGPANVHPENLFLNSSQEKMTANVDHSCIFNFIEVGEKEAEGEKFKIYILKNIANGQYIADNDSKYTPNPIEAFQFTARIAQAKEVINKEIWYEYSNAINGLKCPDADGKNWVLCSTEKFRFLAFNGNPAFNSSYVVATNWRIYAATGQEMSAYEKFDATYYQYFGNISVNEETFPIGIDPGCISAEMYAELKAVFDETSAATSTQQTDAEYNRLTQLILDVVAKLEKTRVPLTAGYYALVNASATGGLMGSEYSLPQCNKELTKVPEIWTIDNAKYIWKLEETAEANKYYLQSVATDRYVTKGSNPEYTMTEKPKTKFDASIHHGYWWIIKDNGKYFHVKPKDGKLNNYGKSEDLENHWRFAAIESSAIEALRGEITQANLNNKLANRVKHITINLKGLQNKCGLTMDGYYAYTGNGLASSFAKTNASDGHAGSEEKNAFDHNVETVYQTLWNPSDSAKAPQNEYHWVQVDLGEAMDSIVLKFTRRANNITSIPTRIAVFSSKGDSLKAEDWSEKLYEGDVKYTYGTEFGDTIADSTTYINTIKFAHPVQHIRLTATKTSNDKLLNSGGPTWCVAEMRFYNAANNVHNLSYDQIPQDTIAKLNAVIEKANKELEAGLATQATLDELEAANDAVWDAYPNPNGLRKGLESAYMHYEIAVESTTNSANDWGYYQQGAKAEFLKSYESIKAVVDDESKVFTLAELNALEAQLEQAFALFTSKLIVPTDGVYHLISASGIDPKTGVESPSQGAYIASADPDYRTAAVWAYKDDEEISSRWNTLWEIKKDENNQFSFKNLATGWYLENPYEGLTEEQQDSISLSTHLTFSKTPKHLNLLASPEAGKFVLKLKENRFMNASNQKIVNEIGHPMAIWSNFNEVNSRYIFEPVDELGSTYNIKCTPNALQIVSVPMDLQYAYTNNSNALKVVGRKDSLIQLKPYEDSENIPAGTPFFVQTAEGENFFVAKPAAESIEALLNTTYNYTPVIKDGLVSALEAVELKPGYGILFQDKVLPTMGGENIHAGSGFFNKEIPTTTEDGTISLLLKGELQGEGTAIENVIFNPTGNNDVYTITGVKVRHNVNGIVNTLGLPKGIYIVGGKKVIVK